MPYLGRTSFLQFRAQTENPFCPVSMPYLGRTSFLQTMEIVKEDKMIMCQCPISGGPHFYPTPLRAQYLCGSQSLFLQVIFRIF